MIKLYYHPSPNPAKVALFLEEAGLPYEMVPVDTRKGEQFKPRIPRDQPQRQDPGADRWRRHGLRQQRDPALPRREDRPVPAARTRRRRAARCCPG